MQELCGSMRSVAQPVRYLEQQENKKPSHQKKKGPRVGGGGSTFISGLEDTSGTYSSTMHATNNFGSSHMEKFHDDDASVGHTTQHHQRPTIDRGLSVVDAPGMRKALKQENMELLEERALLKGRIRQLEMQGPSAKELKVFE